MATKVVATTGLSKEVVEVEWKIPNFDQIKGNGKWLDEQKFELLVPQGSNRCATLWTFFLSRNGPGDWLEGDGDDADEPRWTGVFHALRSKHPNTKVYSSFRVLINSLAAGAEGDGADVRPFFDSKTSMMRMNANEGEYDVINCGWGYPKTIKFGEPVPLLDGCLTINLELTVFTPSIPGLVDPQNSLVSKQEKMLACKLAEDLSKLENSKELSDIKIVTMEGKEHLASKTMLSARSPVFARMFKANLKEVATGVVNLEEISSQTILTILHYIYTEKVSFESKTASDIMDVVYAADKYDLEELRQCCDEILSTKWNQLNAEEALEAARNFRLTKTESKLKEHVKQQATYRQYRSLMSQTRD